MPYRIRTSEDVPEGIRRAADEQLGRALASLRGERSSDRHDALHDARKRFKKVRALLRVVRDEIGEETYGRENACYRDAGRELSDVRDSRVLVATVERLRARYDEQLYARAFESVLGELRERHRELTRRHLDEEARMAGVATTVEAARRRIASWPVERGGPDAFDAGLRRIYRRGHARFAEAYEAGTVEAFHEWRKRVKYLWYATRILRGAWDGVQRETAREIHRLADLLGDDHDLGVLRARLAGEPGAFGDAAQTEALAGLAQRTSVQLRTEARPLAERVYAETPKRYVERIATWWRAREAERELRPLGDLDA